MLPNIEYYEIPILDFSPIGSLKFFTMQSVVDFKAGKVPNTNGNVYWRDAKGFGGPFRTLYSALEDYKLVVGQRKSGKAKLAEAKATGKLIEVDFIKKKRI